MELTALGAVMKFAIDRETAIAELVDRALANDGLADHSKVLDKLAGNTRKNLKLLERTRRENINEIVIEPISGLDASPFPQPDGSSAEADADAFKKGLAEILATSISFYEAAERKIPNEDVCRNLAMITKKTRKIAQQLESN